MSIDPRAGRLPDVSTLVDLTRLEGAYYSGRPDAAQASQRVVFGTSGHRGSSLRLGFNEDHIAAITSAICDWRHANGVDGPLYMGMDTHALSGLAHQTALEVLVARGVRALVASGGGFTPTPAVSRAIVVHNRRGQGRADGIVVTPSHNPPEDGGFKYDPPHGGPADSSVTAWIERRANELLTAGGARAVARVPVGGAIADGRVGEFDFLGHYVNDLEAVIDMKSIAHVAPRIGVDPMGGASVQYWGRIAERHGLDLTVVNSAVDKTFRFVPLDHDGKIRTDCSSPYAMASLIAYGNRFDVSVGNDADADRHGVVTPEGGLLPPNHYLSVASDYLFRNRAGWPASAAIGKTAVTSNMVERVAHMLSRTVVEVPVGFKWFVPGLEHSSLGFAGEESAGASFLARDGSTWTTDKDGILLGLLAAEILAVTGQNPAQRYAMLEGALGRSHYERQDTAADAGLRDRLRRASPTDWAAPLLAGDPVTGRRTTAAGGGELGGLKVTSDQAWFAVRPSGTEDVYKLYAESFRSRDHLQDVLVQAKGMVSRLIG